MITTSQLPTSFIILCFFFICRDDSSFNFMLFFFVFFFQFLFSVLYALGIGGMGACGLIGAIGQLAEGTASGIVSGILMLAVGIGFTLTALGDFYCLITVFRDLYSTILSVMSITLYTRYLHSCLQIHKLYRSSGASLAKAQAEFASGVMRNEHVQSAATAAASAAARETMRNQFGGGGGGGGGAAPNHEAPRY